MSHVNGATPGADAASAVTQSDWRTLREAVQTFWTVADGYAKRRLLLALVLVAASALLAAMTPIALKLAVDGLTTGAGKAVVLAPTVLVVLYVIGQYLTRSFTEMRMLMYSQAEQQVRHQIGRRLFEHLVQLPSRFHLERKTGAIDEGAFRSSPLQAVNGRGELAFENVSFSYREDKFALRKVSFRVPAGRTVAVVGVSGSGKSSLIRLLFRLYEPDAGRILLDGVPVAQLSLSAVRQAIAVVPQDTVLFHDTIANNIGFGRQGSSRREIEEAAKVAHLHDFIMSLKEGYDTMVGERGLKLSGGERQRVAIARAALKRPRIYVFDEATASLDSKTEAEILRNLDDVASRSTTFVIAHRLSTVVHADEILVLDQGVIVERGTHEELRERGGHYSALWQAQQGEASNRGGVAMSMA